MHRELKLAMTGGYTHGQHPMKIATGCLSRFQLRDKNLMHQSSMSSREIAELTGSTHDNVMTDIRKMLTELHGEGGVFSFQNTHINPQNGQIYPVFKLPKRESLILVSGYNVQMRARIIDR